jgi:inner membrane protease ATP23
MVLTNDICSICIRSVDNVLKFMRHHMAMKGCPTSKDHYVCRPCDEAAGGHFSLEEGIVLCENQLRTEQHLAETAIHETIHAFDHCRIKIDWSNCYHHACSEIRAANLSGDCRMMNEWARGHYGFSRHHQVCPGSCPDA